MHPLLSKWLGRATASSPRNYYDDTYRTWEKEHQQSMWLQREMHGEAGFARWEEVYYLMRQFKVDLHWMLNLYKAVIIPQVERFGYTKRKEAERSEYRAVIDLDYEEYNDRHEMMRLGCVHLFHKFETFRVDLVKALDGAFSVANSKEGITATIHRMYGIELRGAMGVPLLRELAFVANSMKHTGSKPNKSGSIPKRFEGVNPDTKVKVYDFELLRDIEAMEMVSIDLFHVLAVVHHRRRLDAAVAAPHFSTLAPRVQESLRLERKFRTGNATWLVRRFFTEISDDVSRRWPPDPDPWPPPEEDMKRMMEA